ncbi:50S ribosomal protein L4 [Falsiporphyromonas endometrii]|uniref:Large ribosomal subunit protein uL4 n=1 Tax=Falsiporphyromonas endometrii TaxID=1387297 RepID=A0ABV9K549_9PORP|nr:50S ribosomal protein L4 [Porphyromonadaceae bacterium]
MELSVFNIKGEDTGRKVQLEDSVFAVQPNDHAIYLDVKQFLANQRQGTHKTKERSELSGSTRKLIRQKGGGGARRGDINSPVLVGGARVFGPRPRNYGFKLNKKLKSLARKSALTYKANKNEIIVLENFDMAQPKTKDFKNILAALKLDNVKSLIVMDDVSENTYLSARNIPNVSLMRAAQLSTYAVLNNAKLVLTEQSVELINQQFKG